MNPTIEEELEKQPKPALLLIVKAIPLVVFLFFTLLLLAQWSFVLEELSK